MIRTALFTAATMAFAAPAIAQDCQSAERLYTWLAEEYGEAPVGMGTHSSGSIMSFWGNRNSGSWSLVKTDPDTGISCLVLVGGDFQLPDYLLGEAM